MGKYYQSFFDCAKDCDLTKCDKFSQTEIDVCEDQDIPESYMYTVNSDNHLIVLEWADYDCKGAEKQTYDHGLINTCINDTDNSFMINFVTESSSAISSIDKLN